VTTSTGSPHTLLLLGGTSDIGLAVARRLAADGLQRLILAVRDPGAAHERLTADPIAVPTVAVERWDALDADGHEPFLAKVAAEHGDIDVVVCAVGALGHHAGLGMPLPEATSLLAANFTGPAAAVLAAGRHLEAQRHGAIVVLSSIAGVRARKSNFVYGAAKAGLDAFSQGLGDALAASGVAVHVVRPGFVRTRMTEGLREAPFSSDPEAVADAVAEALRKGRGGIVYVPKVARPILGVLGRLPQPAWRRLVGER
jgi:decaprenylphospho-beta-D-erythro-pentofuranosid-2-ulose 2-reductase